MKSKFGGLDFESVEVLTRQEQIKVQGGYGGFWCTTYVTWTNADGSRHGSMSSGFVSASSMGAAAAAVTAQNNSIGLSCLADPSINSVRVSC